jgi:hypothetical protein
VGDQAIVFLTHIKSESVLRHFQRLREETKELLTVLLCVHEPGLAQAKLAAPPQLRRISNRILAAFQLQAKYCTPTPDFTTDAESGARLLPHRFAEMQRRGLWYNTGFPDLAYMPALLSKRLREFEYIWLLENDVDYAGNWRDFFCRTMGSCADLLGTCIYARQPDDDWCHWSWFQTPPEISFYHHTRSFNPIVRFSRRMLSLYVSSMQDDRWQGHTEALYATIARHHGFTISDLGGTGAFCPEQWRGKNYHNPWMDGWHKYTFIDAPSVQSAYFHQRPKQYLQRDVLYHPVKVGWTKNPEHKVAFLTVRKSLRPLKAAFNFCRHWL